METASILHISLYVTMAGLIQENIIGIVACVITKDSSRQETVMWAEKKVCASNWLLVLRVHAQVDIEIDNCFLKICIEMYNKNCLEVK